MRDRIPVLDHGYVELLDSMGSDIDIVNAARTSFDVKSIYHVEECPETSALVTWEKAQDCFDAGCSSKCGTCLSDRDTGLIGFLMRERHGTPLEMVDFRFAVKAPIFVFREWHRHRIASINEMSGRYVELEREFYIPSRDDIREQKGKAGAYYYERVDDDCLADNSISRINDSCNNAFDTYESLLNSGIAKEVARLVLPLNTYSKMVWKTNLRSLLNFLSLRNHQQAQREIMYYAAVIEQIVSTIVPVTINKFIEYDRVAP